MKKMENISRSPCISLTTSTLQGLSTIHAYNRRDSHIEMYDAVFFNQCGTTMWSLLSSCSLSYCRFKFLNDINSNHYLLFHSGTRWLSFWLDFMAATMTLMVSLFVVLSSNDIISSSLKGLALSYTIQVNKDPLGFGLLPSHVEMCLYVITMFVCCAVDGHASICSKRGN